MFNPSLNRETLPKDSYRLGVTFLWWARYLFTQLRDNPRYCRNVLIIHDGPISFLSLSAKFEVKNSAIRS